MEIEERFTQQEPPAEKANAFPDGHAVMQNHLLQASMASVLENKPPDDGLIAWLQVVAVWMIFFNTLGLLNSFGVFQTYYTSDLLQASTPSDISWIGGIQSFLLMIIGAPCGRLLDAGYLHTPLSIGTFLQVFGMVVASFSTKYWQILLSQGLCVGLGAGFIWYPCPIIIGQFFDSKRMMALGIAGTGSSVAGIVYPVVVRTLLKKIGFGWTMRVLALITLITLILCNLVVRLRLPPRKQGSFWENSAFKEAPYVTFVAAFTLIMTGSYIPYYYVGTYARTIGVTSGLAFWLLPIMNACSIAGRTFPNHLADKVGGLNVMFPSVFLSGLVVLLWTAVSSTTSLITLVALYGFLSGSMVSLPPAIFASLTARPDHIGTRIGMAYTIAAFGALVGNPMAGAILSSNKHRLGTSEGKVIFLGTWILAGSILVLGGLLTLATRCMKAGSRSKVVGPLNPPIHL